MLRGRTRIIPPMTTTEALTRDTPLAASIEALRRGATDLATHVDAICDRLEAIEGRVRAFVPEPGRRQRLHDAAAVLVRTWPTPEARPPLYGVAVGVKDIMAVDGLPTRGGSMVPPEALAMPQAEVVTALLAAGALVRRQNRDDRVRGVGSGPHGEPARPSTHARWIEQRVRRSHCVRDGAACPRLADRRFGHSPRRLLRRRGVQAELRSHPHLGRPLLLAFGGPRRSLRAGRRGLRVAAGVAILDWSDVTDAPRPVLGVPEGPYLEQADAGGLEGLETALGRLEGAGIEVRRVPLLDDIEEINRRHNALTLAEFGKEHAERFAEYGGLYRPRNATNMDRAREAGARRRGGGTGRAGRAPRGASRGDVRARSRPLGEPASDRTRPDRPRRDRQSDHEPAVDARGHADTDAAAGRSEAFHSGYS